MVLRCKKRHYQPLLYPNVYAQLLLIVTLTGEHHDEPDADDADEWHDEPHDEPDDGHRTRIHTGHDDGSGVGERLTQGTSHSEPP